MRILPYVSCRLAVTLMAALQSILVAAQESSPQQPEQTAGGGGSLSVPAAPHLVISEFFVPRAKMVDPTKRTIALPSGAVTAVPLELWQPNKLLNTTEGPVQLPQSFGPAAEPNHTSSTQPQPKPSSLPKSGWKNANSMTCVGAYMTVVRDGKVMTRNKLNGSPQDWADWCRAASELDRKAGVIPPGYEWKPTSDGRAVAVPIK